MKTLKTILLTLISAVIIFVLIILLATSGPVKFSKGFLDEFTANNLTEAFELTSPEFQEAVGFDTFAKMAEILRVEDVTDYSVPARAIETENGVTTGSVEAKLNYSEEEFTTIDILLMKKEGEWQINVINVEPELLNEIFSTESEEITN